MLLLMSHKGISRLKVLATIVDSRLSSIYASREIVISPRQTFRLDLSGFCSDTLSHLGCYSFENQGAFPSEG